MNFYKTRDFHLFLSSTTGEKMLVPSSSFCLPWFFFPTSLSVDPGASCRAAELPPARWREDWQRALMVALRAGTPGERERRAPPPGARRSARGPRAPSLPCPAASHTAAHGTCRRHRLATGPRAGAACRCPMQAGRSGGVLGKILISWQIYRAGLCL
jgi:hypothetical protein